MGIRLPSKLAQAKHILFRARSLQSYSSPASPTAAAAQLDVPRGHMAVYVGEKYKHRFVIPISYLSHPLFQDLLRRSEEEYGFDHPMGGITIPCSETTFLNLTSRLNGMRGKCRFYV